LLGRPEHLLHVPLEDTHHGLNIAKAAAGVVVPISFFSVRVQHADKQVRLPDGSVGYAASPEAAQKAQSQVVANADVIRLSNEVAKLTENVGNRVPTTEPDRARATDGIEPSPFGELQLSFPISPASIQSSAARKEAQQQLIKAELARFRFLLTGDVQVEVTWVYNAKARYESDTSPDVDNILKPLLDALTGLDGILVDDCQVNAIGASCISGAGPERVEVTVKHGPDDFIAKVGLVFIDVGRALCVPVTERLPLEVLQVVVGAIENMLELRTKMDGFGVDLDPRMTMIGPRVFHKSRVTLGFKRESLATFKKRNGLT
jgi:Holliday junction resolvase RusA-like endonuclease